MNKKLSTLLFASTIAVFTFSTMPAHACAGSPKCPKHAEKKMEKKCKKGCTKPCCKKAQLEKKCKKSEVKKKCTKGKNKPHHNDNSRYND